MLTAMFVVFILQIFCRYVLNYPLGWTIEACLLCWLWLVFWGCAFRVKNDDHVRFDILYSNVPRFVQLVFSVISAIAIIAALVLSFPATLDFVQFMKIESTSLLHIRFDYVFSIYLIFAIAVILRYSLIVLRLVIPELSALSKKETNTRS